MPARTRLAQLIAQREGFFKPGSLPQREHNPGDLRHSPHAQHPGNPDAIGVIDSDADGWDDLERQLRIYAERGWDLQRSIYTYAPPNENESGEYLGFICQGLGLPATASVAEALQIPAVNT